jgi:hypothetical protein
VLDQHAVNRETVLMRQGAQRRDCFCGVHSALNISTIVKISPGASRVNGISRIIEGVGV